MPVGAEMVMFKIITILWKYSVFNYSVRVFDLIWATLLSCNVKLVLWSESVLADETIKTYVNGARGSKLAAIGQGAGQWWGRLKSSFNINIIIGAN